jgi:hypothetical protein
MKKMNLPVANGSVKNNPKVVTPEPGVSPGFPKRRSGMTDFQSSENAFL